MTMAACYANYDMVALGTHGIQQHHSNTQQLYSQQQHHNHNHQHQQQQQQQQQTAYSGHHQQHTSNRLSATLLTVSSTSHNAVGNCNNVNVVNAVGISTQSSTSNQQHNTGSVISNSTNNNPNTSNQNASVSALTPASNVTLNNPSTVSCNAITSSKDYTIPLHVDCSVEYELPNQPKPPVGQRIEPLLMIHPCYFRKMESQRRSPFVNNMPVGVTARSTAVTLVGTVNQTGANNTSVNTQNSSLGISTVKRIRQPQTQVIQQHQHQQLQRQTVVTAVTAQQYQQQLHNQQHLRHVQQQSQQQQHMSQMSQQAHYPVVVSHQQHQHHQQSLPQSGNSADSATVGVASTYVDQQTNLVIRRSGTHRINRNQQQPQLTQSQRFLSQQQVNSQWDQLNAPRSSMTPIHIINTYNPTNNQNSGPNHSTNDNCTRNAITKKVINMVGKRDAMISGGTAYPKESTSNNGNKHNQHHPGGSMATIDSLWNASTSHEVSTITSSTVDMSTSTCNPNTVSIELSVNRSPMAAVPSNYQAGPDTAPVQKQSAVNINRNHDNFHHQNYHNQTHDHLQHTSNNNSNNDTNSSNNNSNAHYSDANSSLHHLQQQQQQLYPDKFCGKYRQYFKAQRMHPYVATAASNLGQTFPQFTAATAAAVAAATPSFQHLQQISCYNV